MPAPITLSAELRSLIEARLDQTLKGIEDTLARIIEKQELNPQLLQDELKSLEESFDMLFQKWNLEILYTLFLKGTMGFGELKKVLGVNSRTQAVLYALKKAWITLDNEAQLPAN